MSKEKDMDGFVKNAFDLGNTIKLILSDFGLDESYIEAVLDELVKTRFEGTHWEITEACTTVFGRVTLQKARELYCSPREEVDEEINLDETDKILRAIKKRRAESGG